ncbi:MAG: large subunit ribosomal protein L31 [Candidatus Azotimanducaceae bacterium]|jgi:large subunit ribosomal protein L31
MPFVRSVRENWRGTILVLFWDESAPINEAAVTKHLSSVRGLVLCGTINPLGLFAMKAEIHPKYQEIQATCSCGNVITTRSTVCEDLHLEVCSNCHPFYTGKQKVIDSAGRIDRFNKRFKRGSD